METEVDNQASSPNGHKQWKEHETKSRLQLIGEVEEGKKEDDTKEKLDSMLRLARKANHVARIKSSCTSGSETLFGGDEACIINTCCCRRLCSCIQGCPVIVLLVVASCLPLTNSASINLFPSYPFAISLSLPSSSPFFSCCCYSLFLSPSSSSPSSPPSSSSPSLLFLLPFPPPPPPPPPPLPFPILLPPSTSPTPGYICGSFS